MPELVSLAQAAARLGCTRAAMSKWRNERDFPPVTQRGRALVVDYALVQRWALARRRDQAVAGRERQREAEYRRLHRLLWRRARWIFDPLTLSLVLADCVTADDLRRKARELGVGSLP